MKSINFQLLGGVCFALYCFISSTCFGYLMTHWLSAIYALIICRCTGCIKHAHIPYVCTCADWISDSSSGNLYQWAHGPTINSPRLNGKFPNISHFLPDVYQCNWKVFSPLNYRYIPICLYFLSMVLLSWGILTCFGMFMVWLQLSNLLLLNVPAYNMCVVCPAPVSNCDKVLALMHMGLPTHSTERSWIIYWIFSNPFAQFPLIWSLARLCSRFSFN